MGADFGPLIFAFYYLPCAVVWRNRRLAHGLWARLGPGKTLTTAAVGAIGVDCELTGTNGARWGRSLVLLVDV